MKASMKVEPWMIAAILFLGYVFSPAPVAKLIGSPRSEYVQKAFTIFYSPLIYVYEHVPPYKWILDWEFETLDHL